MLQWVWMCDPYLPAAVLAWEARGELPALPPSVTWHVFTPPFSCSETNDEATEQPGDTGEEEPTPHCLWVDKFAPRRYIELLSDDVSCQGQRGLGGCVAL